MRTTLLALLLAATVAAPAVARERDQSRPDRAEREAAPQAPRVHRGDAGTGAQARPDRGGQSSFRSVRQDGNQVAGAPGQVRARPGAPQGSPVQYRSSDTRSDGRGTRPDGAWHAETGRDRVAPRPAGYDGRQQDARSGYDSRQQRGSYGYAGQHDGRDRYDPRQRGVVYGTDQRGHDGRYGYDPRQHFAGARNDRGAGYRSDGWDRNWRSDPRYDWRGYRAQNRQLFYGGRYYAPRGYRYTRWQPGYRVQPFFYARQYWISDPWRYRLPAAYGPYQWVRYFGDAVLIDLDSGFVMDVLPGFFF